MPFPKKAQIVFKSEITSLVNLIDFFLNEGVLSYVC